MLFATLHPERVEKLIVVDISPRAYPEANQNVIAALRSVDLDRVSSRKEVEGKLRKALNDDEATIQFLLKSLYWKEGDEKKLGWRFNLDVIAKNMTVAEPLTHDSLFTKPVLFIRGQKSNFISPEDELLIKKHFPKAEIKTVADAGHWVHAENPKGFMNAALEYLNRA